MEYEDSVKERGMAVASEFFSNTEIATGFQNMNRLRHVKYR